MTIRQINDKHRIFLHGCRFDLFHRLFHAFFRHLFPAVIQRFQVFRQHHRISPVFRTEQFQRTLCGIQPPPCIDTRPDDKSDMIRVQPVHRHIGALHQRFQPLIAGPFQHLQSLFDKNPIFSTQVHHIPHRRDRHIFHQIIHILRIALHHFIQCFHQFICHRRSAKTLKRIFTILAVRVYDRICLWEQIFFLASRIQKRNLMVICHDHSQPPFFSVKNFLSCRDPIVTSNDRIDSVLQRTIDQITVQSVSVPDPVRNIRIHIGAESGKPLL